MTDALNDWKGKLGTEYTERHAGTDQDIENRINFFSRVFRAFKGKPEPQTILEVGANVGLNMRALQDLRPGALLTAVEPNDFARAILARLKGVAVYDAAAEHLALDDRSVDLAFTMGVLIHVDRGKVLRSMEEIFRVTKRYILCAEYFAPQEREITYRGKEARLWADDYGSLYLTRFPALRVIDYGFAWREMTGLDNLVWTLFEKTQ